MPQRKMKPRRHMVAKVMLKIFSFYIFMWCGRRSTAPVWRWHTENKHTVCSGDWIHVTRVGGKTPLPTVPFCQPLRKLFWEGWYWRNAWGELPGRGRYFRPLSQSSIQSVKFLKDRHAVAQRHQHAVWKHEECSVFVEGWFRVSSYVRNRS